MVDFKELLRRLDTTELKLKHAGNPHPAGLIITKDMDINKVPERELPLMHTMLHMFYGNNSGMGLSKKTIENLHNRVVERLNGHTKFDRLDNK